MKVVKLNGWLPVAVLMLSHSLMLGVFIILRSGDDTPNLATLTMVEDRGMRVYCCWFCMFKMVFRLALFGNWLAGVYGVSYWWFLGQVIGGLVRWFVQLDFVCSLGVSCRGFSGAVKS